MLATPHSRQRGLSRDVINPQAGHILCDRNPVVCGFSLPIQRSNRIVSSTISIPREILVTVMEATLRGEFCIDPAPLKPREDVAELIDIPQDRCNRRGQTTR